MKKNRIERSETLNILESTQFHTPELNFNTSVRNINYSVLNSHISSFNNFSGNGNGNTIINLQERDRTVFEDLEKDVIKLKQRLNNLKDE